MPPMRLFHNGALDRTVMTLIEYNMRTGRERIADIHAQRQAGSLIEDRLLELYARHGAETIEALFEDIFDYTEERFRARVAQLPDGDYEFEDFSDKDIMHPEHPRIRVHCRLTIEGDRASFDFRESDAAPVGPFRLSPRLAGDRGLRRHAALLPAARAAQPRAEPGGRGAVGAGELRPHRGADAGLGLRQRRLREGRGGDHGLLGGGVPGHRAQAHVRRRHQPRQPLHRRRPSQDRQALRELPLERGRPGRAQLQGWQPFPNDDFHRRCHQPAGGDPRALVSAALHQLRRASPIPAATAPGGAASGSTGASRRSAP